ncbi:hypothetical protein AB0B31_23185 [Catellatospora citrea]|uniref:hypothetical protein n=1 Tax=Catellatospora citrea TaxID=53366 RepID=UPI0033E4D791
MKKTTRLVVLASATILTASLVWVTSAGRSGANDGQETLDGIAYLTAQQTMAEYEQEATKWTFAPMRPQPKKTYADTLSDGKQAMYQKGTARIDASFDWWCSWARMLVEAQTPADHDTALPHVLSVHQTPFYAEGLVPQDRPVFDHDVVTPAQAGDYSGVKAAVTQNCA